MHSQPEVPNGAERTGPSSDRLRRLVVTLAAALVVILLAEATASIIHHNLDVPDGYDTSRNPMLRRGWPEYTRPPTPAEREKRAIILISNSQAFLRERADASSAYAAVLERLLQARRDPLYEVLNWSVPGTRITESTLLAARTAPHEPEMIIYVYHGPNITNRPRRISYYESDAWQMAYMRPVRRYIPPAFLKRTRANRPVEWLMVNTGLGKAHNWLEPWRDERWTWVPWEPTGPLPGKFESEVGPWNDYAAWNVNQFWGAARSAAPKAQLLFVQMPLCVQSLDSTSWDNSKLVFEDLSDFLSDRPNTTVMNARDVVDLENFYPKHPTSHMGPEGHRQFAVWLYRAITDIQGQGGNNGI